MSTSIQVSNIGSSTSEKEVRDFFSFCGKIQNIQFHDAGADGKKSASVTFEKESAAKTALLLHDTTLGGSNVHVSGAGGATSAQEGTSQEQGDSDDLAQEDKPRSRVAAELLAHGYALGDQVLNRAIEFDNKNGLSTRFQNALKQFDSKTNASSRAQALDEKYQASTKVQEGAKSAWLGLSSYYEKFTGTPSGQRVHSFYLSTTKQATDIHNEALRLAGLKEKYAQGSASGSEKHTPHPIGDTGKTDCTCGGADGVCGCAPGQCACAGCAKSKLPAESGAGTSATGPADVVAASSNVAPLGEKKV